MSEEATFRTALAFALLGIGAVGMYHRLASQATDEKLDRRQEGLFVLVTLRAAGLALWLGVLAYLVNPAWMAWSSVPLPSWMRWLGVGVCALGILLFTWTLRSLGPNLTDTVVTRRAHTLVTHGPYRWVRHPFYDSTAVLILAVSLMAANWFLLLAGGVVLSLLVMRTRTEEANLVARFGDAYRSYMRRTGRFLPRNQRHRRG